jgi:hypothetical protein
MSFYQDFIRELNPKVNPAGVEASMRLRYGTLDHLDRTDFKSEIRIAIACENEEPGFLRKTAESFGMGEDFNYWEAKS